MALDQSYLRTHLSVDTVADLSALDTGGLADGCIATVTGRISSPTVTNADTPFFMLSKTATNAPAANQVLVSANSDAGSDPGRWIRLALSPDL